MARIQIQLPDRFIFSTQVQIYISHVNIGGHLDNAQLLTLVSEARTRFFVGLGYPDVDVDGCLYVVGDLVAQYKSEGFYGETLQIDMTPADINKYGFDLLFRMHEVNSGREIARGKTGIVFVSPQNKKVALIPQQFLQRLQPSE
jgi:acyl-CoA thioesterase FadM